MTVILTGPCDSCGKHTTLEHFNNHLVCDPCQDSILAAWANSVKVGNDG